MYFVLVINDKIELLVKIIFYFLGNYGNLVLVICVVGVCFIIVIGLIVIVGEFFSLIIFFKYEKIVVFIVIISFLLLILGVESIIRIFVFILVFIYFIIIFLIVLNLFGKYIKNDYVYKGVVLFIGIIGFIESLDLLGIKNYYIDLVLEIFLFLDYGLIWLFFGLVGYIFFLFMFRKVKK